MSYKLDIGVELDRDRTVFGVVMPNGEKKIFTIPSQIGIDEKGIAIGTNTEDTGVCQVFENNPTHSSGANPPEKAGAEYPLVLFLSRSITQIKTAVDHQIDQTVEVGSGYFSIPGGTANDIVQAIRHGAAEAGFSDVEIERRPTLATRRASQQSSAETVLSIVIGAGEADLALYRIDESDITTIARSSHPELGSREWSQSLSETILEQVGLKQDALVEYTKKSLEDLAHDIRLTTRENLKETDESDVRSISHKMGSGAKLVAGNHTLSDEIHIDRDLDLELQYEALESYLRALLNQIHSLSKHADIAPDEIDLVVGSGDGYSLTVIHQTIEDAVPDTTSVIKDDSFKQSVKTAVELAQPEQVGLQATETLSHRIALRGVGNDGIQREIITPILSSTAEDQLFTLKTVNQKQMQGRFDIEFLPPGSDVCDKSLSVLLTGIPCSIDDTPVEIPIRLAVNTTELPNKEDISVSVNDFELSDSIHVTIADEAEATSPHYVVLPGHQNIDPPQYDEIDGGIEYATEQTPLVDTVEQLDQADIANAIHEVRADLWNLGVSDGRSLDPSDIKILLRELDQRLSQCGVEFYVPELGTEAQPRRHKIRKQEPADAEEGAIIEVLKPGMRISGEQAVSAIVSISNGESPEEPDNEEAMDDATSLPDPAENSSEKQKSAEGYSNKPRASEGTDNKKGENQDEKNNPEEHSRDET